MSPFGPTTQKPGTVDIFQRFLARKPKNEVLSTSLGWGSSRRSLREVLGSLGASWKTLNHLGPILEIYRKSRCRLFLVCPEDPGGFSGRRWGAKTGPKRLRTSSKLALGFNTVLQAISDPSGGRFGPQVGGIKVDKTLIGV